MTKELNTLLTALYVLIDDHVVPPRAGRGRRPLLSDSELITLAVAQVLLRYPSERRWIRHIRSSAEWQVMFPYLPEQSGYHKRLKNVHPLLCKAVLVLAACCPSWFDDVWIADATPVPCGMSRETVKRSDLAGHAGYGYCAAHSRFYWGLKLYLVCAGDGMPIMWCLANPKLGEREVLAALLERNHHLIRSGQILLADKGFAGKHFHELTAALGLRLLRPDRRDETYRHGNLGHVRQWIESVNQTLKGQLDLEHHGARTPAGVFTRVAQRLLAMAAGIWQNWETGVTSKRSLIAFDH
ncbi:IS982 family transposase [Kibdelosporangium philippinense]|uniref:IS982 family transposase n=2 Tax=Kibdelosporangium philippinense TaxID=211113 RepID=A0ABS8ZNW9_9PSEU|nr:IS982 family transposase [Kibdelosporangium philippinense]MCE7002275.1 IS982 family transposase [Kibdelosporangium philippinense]MCE7004170.1 IS982 family transposase [Kibdelosporangium philippinense]MCE7006395.1 IS982 family transposase [Kibdelosporangium philippinense]MCE7009232.1 IS982 family transposase [Kibdelosporangium philippinense]MCE7010970.1 IS982 family transposase [Kibdelosporangium philippinense]